MTRTIKEQWRKLRVMRYAGSVMVDYRILRNWMRLHKISNHPS